MKDDFQIIENTLADGIFAAYLLGFDATTLENRAKIEAANFAEGDDEKKDDKLVEQIGSDDLYLQLRFDVPPREAIDYFERKRVVTKKQFNKLSREAKAAAFTVAGIYEKDVLNAFKTEISNALETGQTQKFVIDKFKKILGDGGHKMLGDYHLESIFRTNMQMAYGVGRRNAMEESGDDLPFWEYSAVGDDRTRPTHQALDGITFPVNHPFWDTHYPPWEISCRCSVFSKFTDDKNFHGKYDHDQPNADTTIAYDDDGLPAKAEYKTQVVDLKATKFVGVPKSANLEKVLTDNAKRALKNRKTKK